MKGVNLVIDFIIRYWIQILFGLIITIVGAGFKYISRLVKRDWNDRMQEQLDTLYDKIDNNLEERDIQLRKEDDRINQRLDKVDNSLNILKDGLLTLHRRRFIDDCRKLIEQKEEITMEDYRRLEREHRTYNSLGGNHEGDQLYAIFLQKYQAQQTK